MSIDIRFVALEKWPGQATLWTARKRSQFSAKWSATIDLLESELGHLKARDVVIQADCDRDQIRIDGHFRAGAKMRGPGVVLSFECPKGSMSFPCDRFSDWQANVRAIALSLEALRSVDRYGVTQQAEQYRGWAKLPGPEKVFATPLDAQKWLFDALKVDSISAAGGLDSLRRLAISRFHPDRNDGDSSLWRKWAAVAGMLGIEI